MTKGPGVVIIARHGARLDAADKTWHLTSPTPYDPPLTYGGWTQAKALGLRIATLLHERAKEADNHGRANGANADLAHLDFSPLDGANGSHHAHADGLPRPKRKHKIVIHSSPFLRCVQTSTAIAAGLSQFQPPETSHVKIQQPKHRNGITGHSPLTRSSSSPSPAVQPVHHGPSADPNLEVFPKKHIGPDKILLRIDAFLGEWLSPDYYEDITPPPNSTLMVAGAKADLLRRGEYVEVHHNAQTNQGHFPGGWVKSGTSPFAHGHGRKKSQDNSFPTLGSLAQALPHRERASSQGSLIRRNSRSRERGATALTTAHKVPDHIYDPPVPAHGVNPANPIPRGYVHHARDACLDVDYQWDSMRPPQEWGDGGEYGDEWSTMHKRFRRGLGGMMTWYKEHGCEGPHDNIRGFTYRENNPVPTLQHHATDPGPGANHALDDDEELVLILVTHGAGCNALLGAVSNQPVLLDVGVASLSMAVRRDEPRKPSISSLPTMRRPSVVDVGMSNEYEMKMLASIDHLRAGVDPAKPPQPQSPAVLSSPSLEYRRRFTNSGAGNSPIDSPISIGQPWRGHNSSLGSIRRSSTSGSSSQFYSGASQGSASPSLGLWGTLKPPTAPEPVDGRRSPGSDMVLNFREHKAAGTTVDNNDGAGAPAANRLTNGNTTTIKEEEHHGETDDLAPLPKPLGRSMSQSQHGGLWAPKATKASAGLWGPPRHDDISERSQGPKRRWTVTERE